MKKIIEAKIVLAIEAHVSRKGAKDYDQKVQELKNQILSIPELDELIKRNEV